MISESIALQFFMRLFFPDCDLDLYVSLPHIEIVGAFLIGHGYEFTPTKSQPSMWEEALAHRSVSSTYALEKAKS